MFGLFQPRKLRVMGHDVEVVSIMRDGKLLYTSDKVKALPTDRLEGQIVEVALFTKSGAPYFAYYLCPDYYFATATTAGTAAFGGPAATEEFRSVVSQHVAAFVVQHLRRSPQIDAVADIVSFSHNRVHTNVLAYVQSLSAWYPVQHNDNEDIDATERKVRQVNSGLASINDIIAVDEMSPNAAGD